MSNYQELKALRIKMNISFEAQRKESDVKFEAINARFEGLIKEMNARFDTLEKKINFLQWLIAIGFSFLIGLMTFFNFFRLFK